MPRGDEDIVLFDGGSDGFGPARYEGKDTYHWAVGSNCLSGRWVPSSAYARVLSNLAFAPIACFFDWENSSGEPILIWTGCKTNNDGAFINVFANGSLSTTEHPSGSAQAPFTSGVLYRYDHDATVDPNEEVAFFCNGDGEDVIIRRKKDGTTDVGVATAHDAKADLLAVVGPDLYRVLSNYRLGKLSADTDPGVDANYPALAASVPAGRPSWPINAVVGLGASPYALTAGGVLKYNPAPSSAVFGSVLAVTPHPDNGKGGTSDGRGRIFYPVRDQIIVITFGFQSLQTPSRRTKSIDRNTPFGKLDRFAVDLEHVYGFIAPGFAKTQELPGFKVVSDDGPGSFTDETTAVTDRKFNTSADWTTTPLVSGDYIWVGADEPFSGVYMEFGSNVRANQTTAGVEITASYGKTGGAYESCDVIDGTLCFAQDGLIVFHKSRQHPYENATQWEKTTVNSVERYWIRIEVKSTLTGVKAHAIYALPYRPSIDPDRVGTTAATSVTSYAQSTALPWLIIGTWGGENLSWQMVGPLWTGKIEQALVARVNDGVTDSDNALYFLGPDGLYAMPVGADGNPAQGAWPNLGDSDAFATGIGDHGLMCSSYDFEVEAATVEQLRVQGSGFQKDDELYYYTRWDNETEWRRHGPFANMPVSLPDDGSANLGTGKELHLYWAFVDGSRDAYAPSITRAYIPAGRWTYEDESAEAPEEDITSPQSR